MVINNLVVCRSPKAASAIIRNVAFAIQQKETFSTGLKESSESNTVATFRQNETEIHRLLYSPNVRRVIVVRHPVSRILSAFVYFRGFPGGITMNLSFEEFVFKFVAKYYDENCSEWGTALSLDDVAQHFFPAQHCRCDIPCGVNYEVHRIEETADLVRDLYGMAGATMFGSYAGQTSTARVHEREYNASVFLTPKMITFLNSLTLREQKYFGYAPWEP